MFQWSILFITKLLIDSVFNTMFVGVSLKYLETETCLLNGKILSLVLSELSLGSLACFRARAYENRKYVHM